MTFVGRDRDIAQLWELLEQRSILLTGPRRVGKTELLLRLEQDPAYGWRVIRVDLQGISTVDAAVSAVLQALSEAGLGEAAWKQWRDRVESVGVAGAHLTTRTAADEDAWGRLELGLDRAIAVIGEQERLLLCLDELPWWLDDVRRDAGAQTARLVLARLRAIRQHQDHVERLRMVLTGSVGLSGLANQLGASADINDVIPAVPLRPLDPEAGATLFETEITGRGGRTDPATARHAHELAGGFPHWVKMLAERAPLVEGQVGLEQVDRAVEVLLSVRNRALFNDEGAEHFARRHDAARTKRLQAVLQAAAGADGGAPREALITAALRAGASTRQDAWADVMELVDAWMLDSEDDDESFRFLLPLFRLWWLKYGGSP